MIVDIIMQMRYIIIGFRVQLVVYDVLIGVGVVYGVSDIIWFSQLRCVVL